MRVQMGGVNNSMGGVSNSMGGRRIAWTCNGVQDLTSQICDCVCP
jgi:hypothetical protein